MLNKEYNRKASKEFFENSVTVGDIVWLAGQSDKPSDTFTDMLESDIEGVCKLLGINLDDDVESNPEDEIICRCIDLNKLGFLVRIHAPIPCYIDKDGTMAFGGMSTSKLVYTEDMTGIFEIAEAFSLEAIKQGRGYIEQDKAKAKNETATDQTDE